MVGWSRKLSTERLSAPLMSSHHSFPEEDARASLLGIDLNNYERATDEMRKAAPGLTAEQMRTSITIVRYGGRSQSEIGKVTGFTRQATSRHVAKLVSAGLSVRAGALMVAAQYRGSLHSAVSSRRPLAFPRTLPEVVSRVGRQRLQTFGCKVPAIGVHECAK